MAVVSDNFSRPNGTLGANWGPVNVNTAEGMLNSRTGGILINNDGYGPINAGGGDTNSYYKGTSFQNDQLATAVVKTVAGYTSTISISAATQSGGNTTYTYTLTGGNALINPQYMLISGMQHSQNNGTFTITTFGVGTFTVTNASGITEVGSSGLGVSPSDSGAGVMIRSTPDGQNGYFFHVGTNSFSGAGRRSYYELWKIVNGFGTDLGNADDTGIALVLPSVGASITISACGSTITAYYNGSQIYQVTDTSLAAGFPGITSWSMNGPDEYIWADWTLVVDPPGNNGSSYNNFQAADSNFTLTSLASDTLTESEVTASDPFTYSNGDLHTENANWVYTAGSFQVSSDKVFSSSATISGAYLSGQVWPNDQYSEVTAVVGGTAATQNTGPAVRVSSSANTYYCIQYANNLLAISKQVAGTFTQLVSGGTFPTTGQTVRLQVMGTTLTAFVNGVSQLTHTDASIASGTPGIFGVANATTNGFSSWDASGLAFPSQFTQTAGMWLTSANGAYANTVDGSNWAIAYQNTVSWPAAQYSQATLSNQDASHHAFGPAVYVSSSADTFYIFCNSNNSANIYSVVAGTATLIGSTATTFTNGDVYLLEIYPLPLGNNYLVGLVNGKVAVQVVDDSITSGSAGFASFMAGGTANKNISNWSGGSLTSINPLIGGNLLLGGVIFDYDSVTGAILAESQLGTDA
jgi:hypothetical protein